MNAPAFPGTPPVDEAPLLGIQETAAALGVTMRTLRFYEDKGLIQPRRIGTQRLYGRRELGRMQLVLRGKRLGFSIREIAEFLDLYEVDAGHREQTRRLLDRVVDRRIELERQRDALQQTLDELAAIERQARDALADDG